MRVEEEYQEYLLVWRGIAIKVRHCPSWLSSSAELPVQHIELYVEDREPLPITETGYKSHFLCGAGALTDYDDDPVAFVTAWLEHEAKTQSWSAERQLSLF